MKNTNANTVYYYVCPNDSLFVRGNLAFGDSGEHGASLMPPPPSLFAGAFRSAILGKDAAQLEAFLSNGSCTDTTLAQCLGTHERPGDFRISWLSLAGDAEGQALPEALTPMPADLLMQGSHFVTLEPRAQSAGVQSVGPLPFRATLLSAKMEKPSGGILLRGEGLTQHLQGLPIEKEQGIEIKHVYQRDPRLGIGLNSDAHTVEEGQIYTTEGFAFSPRTVRADGFGAATFASTGFIVGIEGVEGVLPNKGLLRLGGDGRSALYHRVAFSAPAASKLPVALKRFRLLMQTPALFSQGWLPNGIVQQGDDYRLQGDGFSARLACAALGRREVISGWDLYQWKPKPAQSAVPSGSVYWFDEFEGEVSKLAAWAAKGLWPDDPNPMQQARRAEGFNCALLAAWH